MTPITTGDISDVVRLCALSPSAWLAPQRWWPIAAKALSRLQGMLLPSRWRHLEELVPGYLAAASGLRPTAIAEQETAASYEEELALLRCYRPGGWRPNIRLEGSERLDAALAQGKGAVLWVEDIHFASLVVKRALAEHGYAVSHLSRPSHGFSDTPFAHRFLNPIRWRVENRYLKQRVVTKRGDLSGLRRLREELSAGGIVSITVGNNGSQVKAVPFFESDLELATGPVTVARAAGAPLLPVFTQRLPSGTFEVRIEAPLDLSDSSNPDAPFVQFAALLASYVKQYPPQWKGWAYRGKAPQRAEERGRSR
jgi:lauroyl/myristoyl acyltransferase